MKPLHKRNTDAPVWPETEGAPRDLIHITVVSRSFPPAYLNGGPSRSLGGLVYALGHEFRFAVVTSSHDGPDNSVMPSVVADTWVDHLAARVWYSSNSRHALTILKLIDATGPEILYLNSLFDPRFSVLPLIFIRLFRRRVPVLLSPRGELSRGALALKATKKRAFITLFRFLRLHRFVDWQASESQEAADISRVFGHRVRVHVARQLRPDLVIELAHPSTGATKDDRLARSVVFLSRIARKKNLARLILALSQVEGPIRLSIAGPIEDPAYWRECKRLIDDLPSNKEVQYVGTVPADSTVEFLANFDLFVLPTLGENFGHVILESLAAGTPVIVGEDTPFGEVEQAGAGWSRDPASTVEFARAMETFFDLTRGEQEAMRSRAQDLARRLAFDQRSLDSQRAIFSLLASRHPRAK